MIMLTTRRERLLAAAVLAAAIGGVLASPVLAQGGRGPSAEDIAKAKAAETPRFVDGRADLTGLWSSPTEFGSGATTRSADGKVIEFQIAPPFGQRAPAAGAAPRRDAAAPPYKQELVSKTKQLAATDVDTDPAFSCNPNGTPRAGAPSEIFQSREAVVFLYESGLRGDYRVIPTDGRAHDPNMDPTWYGDSVAHWEGATLVVDAVNFTDESWMAGAGAFHSDQIHVVERFTREGDTLKYEVTVEDPQVLTGPWNIPTRTVLLNRSGAHVAEVAPCHERDREHMVDKTHITP